MNAIYLHPVDGFTFLENVPEKPKPIRTLTCGDDQNYSMYELELAAAIEKRMVIGNPDLIFSEIPLLSHHSKKGELYPWPGTWEKMLQVRHGVEWHNLPKQKEGRSPDGIYRTVVILSPPKEERPPQNTVMGQGYHIKKKMPADEFEELLGDSMKAHGLIPGEPLNSAMSYTEGSEPVNSSMSEKEEEDVTKATIYSHPIYGESVGIGSHNREPVVSQDQEEQDRLWMEVFEFRDFRWKYFIEKMKERFTIHRLK